VDPRAGLDDLEKKQFLTLPGLKLRPLSRPARIGNSNGLLGNRTRDLPPCSTVSQPNTLQRGPTERDCLAEKVEGALFESRPNTGGP
jgi:hypothetical protein